MDWFKRNLEWSRKYDEQSIELMYKILKKNLKKIIKIEKTPLEIDVKMATDLMLFRSDSGSIALRIRDIEYPWRDLTIQTQQASGNIHNTEYIKIFIQGHVKWYLYCWADQQVIREWMFVDLDKLREVKIIDDYEEILNKQNGQLFKAISFEDLFENKCVVDSNLKEFNSETQTSMNKFF